MSGIKLIGLSKLVKGQEFALDGNVKIGRSPECDIVVSTNSMSRQHAELRLTDKGYVLKDLGSHNGSFINGEQIKQQIVRDGDQIKIGGARFQFKNIELDEATTPVVDAPIIVNEPIDEVVEEQGLDVVDDEVEVLAADEYNPEEEGEIIDANQNIVNSSVFIGLLVLALIIGAIVLFKSFKPPVRETKVIMMKTGAEKLIDINMLRQLNVDLVPDKFIVKDPSMLKVHFYKDDVKWIMQIEPKGTYGSTLIDIQDEKGQSIQKVEVIIKGMVQPVSKININTLPTREAQLSKLNTFVARARNYEENDVYSAKIEYDKARNLMREMKLKGPTFIEVRTKLSLLNQMIDEHIDLLWEQFYRAHKNQEYEVELKQLESMLQFIKDPQNLDYQLAMIYHNKIEARNKRLKKRR